MDFSLLIIMAITGCGKSNSVTNLKKYQEEYQMIAPQNSLMLNSKK